MKGWTHDLRITYEVPITTEICTRIGRHGPRARPA
jgi:hypothetical protein